MSEKTAIIIGASRGLGLGFAKELAERGYKVIATERKRSEELHVAKANGDAIDIMQCDVTDADSVSAIKAECTEGSVDLLIMNAGVYGGSEQGLDQLSYENVANIMHTNATGPVQAALTLLPLVKRGGTIAMLSSMMGSIADYSGGVSLYGMSKVAQNFLARSLFEEHAKERGVGVISLHPGWVQTDMGGPDAAIDVATSVTGMTNVLEAESEPRHVFLNYDGSTIPW